MNKKIKIIMNKNIINIMNQGVANETILVNSGTKMNNNERVNAINKWAPSLPGKKFNFFNIAQIKINTNMNTINGMKYSIKPRSIIVAIMVVSPFLEYH